MWDTACARTVVFNMFDLSGSGFIGRKDFKKIAMAFIIGGCPARLRFNHVPAL